ncbi:Peptidoglycan O-acetyltransferase [anaerobic digester metagenome]
MLFNSFVFLTFLAVVLPVFYMLKTKELKNVFLLISSYVFYGYWDWRFCTLLLISSVIDFFIGKEIYQTQNTSRRKILLISSLVSNLGILGFFKYFNFFTASFQSAFGFLGLNLDFLHLNIILPVGISFYTFQTLSYSIDIYRGNLKPTSNFVDFSLFVSFFPQLVAGPIERASNLLPQLDKQLIPSRQQVEKGVVLIITGLFRKVMIGDAAGRYVDNFFGNIHLYKSDELVFALVLFSIQIYADFSGYSHIARGTAKLLGVELMKNFEQPYLSRNITEFWRRWHISLSSWLKDYLYFSLGGNKKGRYRTYLNLMITMLLGGLWHGASWNFVIWGGLHGSYLTIHKLFVGNRRIMASSSVPNNLKDWSLFILNIIGTYTLVLFAWLFFRSTSWNTTTSFFERVLSFERGEFTIHLFGITSSFLFVMLLLDWWEYKTGKHTFILNLKSKPFLWGILSCLLIITLIYMFQSEPLPFIYFQF